VNGVCDLLDKIENFNSIQTPIYKQAIKENNINGRVLLHCDLQELKKVIFQVLHLYISKRKSSKQMYLYFLGI